VGVKRINAQKHESLTGRQHNEGGKKLGKHRSCHYHLQDWLRAKKKFITEARLQARLGRQEEGDALQKFPLENTRGGQRVKANPYHVPIVFTKGRTKNHRLRCGGGVGEGRRPSKKKGEYQWLLSGSRLFGK